MTNLRPGQAAGASTDRDLAALSEDLEAFLSRHVVAAMSQAELLGARFDADLAAVDWPRGLGGRGLSKTLQPMLEARFEQAGVAPARAERNVIGLGMAAPVLLSFGDRDQQERWLRPLWTGEEIWCQLFSEPGAGSDLASVATSAVREGDEWIVNGQKVWTSLAHDATWALLLARTDPSLPKHSGLTYFVCDMTADGVEVRPLRQITGEAEFNEVFLTDARVPDAYRLGAPGNGWQVATETLMNERVSISQGGADRETGLAGHLMRDWRAGSRADPATGEQVLDRWIEAESARILTQQLAQTSASGVPGPEGSGLKLVYSRLQQRVTSTWLDVLGARALLFDNWEMRRPAAAELGTRGGPYAYLRVRANTIEGGTSEILRNIVAERVLKLPSEHRVDRDVAWKDLPR